MSEAHVSDLMSLDREVARGARDLARWRAALRAEPRACADDAPLEAVRRVAGKTTYDALGDLDPSAADLPLRDALREWVAALLLARIGRSDEAAWALAASAPTARFAGGQELVSYRQAMRGVVGARTAAEASLWLDAAAEVGPALAAAARTGAERRLEAARRLGLEHPWRALAPAPPAALRAAAARLLARTDAIADAVRGEPGAAAQVHAAMAVDAAEGWPARLRPRWLDDVFGAVMGGLRPALPELPQALGAASFARGLALFGAAVNAAAVPSATPFALARDPGARAAHRLGMVFAGLSADPVWQARALGLGRGAAQAQARALARTLLLSARLDAARLLLGDEAELAPSDRFEELGARVFGTPLDGRLRGAFPAARPDEPARFVALLEAVGLTFALREQFDADWFRNPRAWGHLRVLAAAGAREPVDAGALDAAADALSAAFERGLG